MEVSGFVLVGGASTRMGRSKALLPFRGTTLAGFIAGMVREAAESAALIGDPGIYQHLGYPVYPDRLPGCGPMGGIFTALSVSPAKWNLVVACDMPVISAPVLRLLLGNAFDSKAQCVVARGASGEPEPLCAVYHHSCLPALENSIRCKQLKMRDFIMKLEAELVAVDRHALANVNTPADWQPFEPGSA